ncbi:hypothetical protein ABW21_db0202095 [Orbilia brochopaga]|nr:hypothetical protein ABW21_db0202095 [Drechslerella brochopaga]
MNTYSNLESVCRQDGSMIRSPFVITMLAIGLRVAGIDDSRVQHRHPTRIVNDIDPILRLNLASRTLVEGINWRPCCSWNGRRIRMHGTERINQSSLDWLDRRWPLHVSIAAVLVVIGPVEVRWGIGIAQQDHGNVVCTRDLARHSLERIDNLLGTSRLRLVLHDKVHGLLIEAEVIGTVWVCAEVSIPEVDLLCIAVESDTDANGSADVAVLFCNRITTDDTELAHLVYVPSKSVTDIRSVSTGRLLHADDVNVVIEEPLDLLVVVVGNVGTANPEVEGHHAELCDESLAGPAHGNGDLDVGLSPAGCSGDDDIGSANCGDIRGTREGTVLTDLNPLRSRCLGEPDATRSTIN